jgi:hypothetical protein
MNSGGIFLVDRLQHAILLEANQVQTYIACIYHMGERHVIHRLAICSESKGMKYSKVYN